MPNDELAQSSPEVETKRAQYNLQLVDCGIPNLQTSEKTDLIFPALVNVVPRLGAAIKDSENPHLRNKYADLASVMEACKAPLAASGIAILQPPFSSGADSAVSVTTVLLHTSGQWVSSTLHLRSQDVKPQSIGSAITYARRYSLSGLLGIVTEDDDGNAASGVTAPRSNTREEQKQYGQQRVEEVKRTATARTRRKVEEMPPPPQDDPPSDPELPRDSSTKEKLVEWQVNFRRGMSSMHDEIAKLENGDDSAYKDILADFGRAKSSDFTADEEMVARKCYLAVGEKLKMLRLRRDDPDAYARMVGGDY